MPRVTYKNVIPFKKDLAKRLKGFDYEASIKLPRNHFADTGGTVYRPRSAYEMFRVLNDTFGECIILDQSHKLIAKWIVTYKDGSVEEKVIEKVSLAEEVDTKENIAEEAPESEKFDKDYAESLLEGDDIKKVKDSLEEYGKQFGVNLKKNRTPQNMLKDLKAKVK